ISSIPARLRRRTAKPKECSTAATQLLSCLCLTRWSTLPPARRGSRSTTAAVSALVSRNTPAWSSLQMAPKIPSTASSAFSPAILGPASFATPMLVIRAQSNLLPRTTSTSLCSRKRGTDEQPASPSEMQKLIECVPNFSEGRDQNIIRQITDAIRSAEGVSLLDVDPGASTNRTVVTFVGDPEAAVEAAFRAIKKAAELIDMRKHKGAHPRMGATDVCPFIPVSNVSWEEAIACAKQLGKRVGDELNIPVYLYEKAATDQSRSNLSIIRSGEYEGFFEKIKEPAWKPDFGPTTFSEKSGATAIGAREFLVAYNVNLNTKAVRRATSVAFDVRENGRIKTEDGTPSGEPVLDENGEPVRIPGMLKHVKAIGWYVEEYGIAQVSMNLTNIEETPLHAAFDACNEAASKRGFRVMGSEVVGMLPKKCLVDAGKYFLRKQKWSEGASEEDLIDIAIRSMGLSELKPFDPKEKIIELKMESAAPKKS